MLKNVIHFLEKLIWKENNIDIQLIKNKIYFKKILLKNYQAIYLLNYKEKLTKRIINNLKYYKPNHLFELFGKKISKIIPNKKETILIPIPMSKKRLKKRGYNQSLILVKNINKYLPKTTILDKLIIKKQETITQKSIRKKSKRFKNVYKSFDLNLKEIDKIKNKKIYIIDDVLSSGATILEIIKLLKPYNNKIIVIVIAH